MKGIFKVLSMVILLVALIGAGVLVKKNQETRRGATATETSSQILPDKVETSSGSKFVSTVWVNTGKSTDKLTGVEMGVVYDPSKVKFVGFEASSGYTLVNDSTTMDDKNGGVTIKMVAMGEEKAGAVNLGKMTFVAINGTSSLLAQGKLMISGQGLTWDIAKNSSSRVIVSPVSITATPIDKLCVDNSSCGINEYCYQPPMPVCKPGMACIQKMPAKVCKACTPRQACMDAPTPCLPQIANGSPPFCPPTKKVANEGEMCGGIAGIICASGLKCQYRSINMNAGEQNYPDASGICVKDTLKCEWCGDSCIDSRIKMACKMTAPPVGKSCKNVNGKCTIVSNVTPTPGAVCGQRCTQNQQCQGGMTCAPIWWPCGPMPLAAMNKVQSDQGLTQVEVTEMIRICPTVKGVMPSGYESMTAVKMPSFYGVCRNPKCLSSTNCSCSPTPTPSVVPQCTPVLCKPGEGLYCPTGASGCVGGCGYKCGTPTPTPTVSVSEHTGSYIMQFLSQNAKVGEEVWLNVAAETLNKTDKISATKVKIKYIADNFDVLDIQPEGRGTELMKEIDKTAGTITLYYTWNLPADRLFNRYTVANVKLKPKKEGTLMVAFDRTYSNEMSGIDSNGKSISYQLKMNNPKDLIVSAMTCSCTNGKVKATGDANCDGIINSIDFEIWRNEMFDQGGLFGTIKSGWQSDYNCDQKVSGVDFEIWRKTVFQ